MRNLNVHLGLSHAKLMDYLRQPPFFALFVHFCILCDRKYTHMIPGKRSLLQKRPLNHFSFKKESDILSNIVVIPDQCRSCRDIPQ